MDSAKYLARIDSLCTGDLTAAHGGSDVLMAGSHDRIVSLELRSAVWTGDAAQRVRTVEDFHALKDHLAVLLDTRWGARRPWWMGTLVVRIDRGEPISEPWATCSTLVDDLDLWQPTGTGRWLALGVLEGEMDDEVHLLALVTDTAPP
ncbi:hypothetical protein [Streptomyces sp. LBL]|uniref:hypothetical protein n=1 Tax=Streptomyces sp. LBL TaxID=2940562 RepID=UPI0024741FF4|nr:hypothetical protein [Streptomyces sp. LBL]